MRKLRSGNLLWLPVWPKAKPALRLHMLIFNSVPELGMKVTSVSSNEAASKYSVTPLDTYLIKPFSCMVDCGLKWARKRRFYTQGCWGPMLGGTGPGRVINHLGPHLAFWLSQNPKHHVLEIDEVICEQVLGMNMKKLSVRRWLDCSLKEKKNLNGEWQKKCKRSRKREVSASRECRQMYCLCYKE